VSTAAVIPIRGFVDGKARLHPQFDADVRADLVERMAENVVTAAGSRPVLVVSSAPEVRRWAAGLGLAVLDDPGSLNGAAHEGRRWWAERGASRVVVVHADLPLARTLESVDPIGADDATVYAVMCRAGDGTPALSVPVTASGNAFTFRYGAGSFARHREEAARVGLAFKAVDDPGLSFDVDTLDDVIDLTQGSPFAGLTPAPSRSPLPA